jgi:RNA polymerase sigma factor (sigma-70 family)
MKRILEHLRALTRLHDAAGISDGELLDRFRRQQDEAAFEALVRRHGALVFGVCRRVLGNHHDAEDAFQAAFLVLVRKVASVKPKQSAASWLYGVAYRTALKAKTRAARNRCRERAAAVPDAATPPFAGELQSVLDQELNRLSEKHRSAFVLCSLEGKTHQEAARQLGCREGTLSVRLMRAKQLLAKRLSRRGFGPATAVVPMLAGLGAASATVPASLSASTVKAAVAIALGEAATGLVSAEALTLMQGVLQAMFFTRLKIATLFVLAGLGAAWGVRPLMEALRAGSAEPQQAAPQATPAPAATDPKSDLERLQGTWQVTSLWEASASGPENAKAVPAEVVKNFKYVFRGAEVTFSGPGEADKGKATFKLNPDVDPKPIDLIALDGPAKGKTRFGIYRIAGDMLVLAIGANERPKRIRDDFGGTFVTLRREAPPDGAVTSDARIRKLLVDRVDALKKARDSRYLNFSLGKEGNPDVLIEAERRLMEAELELCATDAERVATMKRAVDRIRLAEVPQAAKFAAETIGPSSYYATRALLLEVELAYERAKAKRAK